MSVKNQRAAIEKTYDAKCNIYIFAKSKENSITSTVKKLEHENISCALSQKELKTTNQTGTVNNVKYDAKLFLAPEIEILPGSVIEVFRYGRVYLFEATGESFVYPTHQEALLLRNTKA